MKIFQRISKYLIEKLDPAHLQRMHLTRKITLEWLEDITMWLKRHKKIWMMMNLKHTNISNKTRTDNTKCHKTLWRIVKMATVNKKLRNTKEMNSKNLLSKTVCLQTIMMTTIKINYKWTRCSWFRKSVKNI